MIRIVIADDEPIIRSSLTGLQWEEEGFAVAGVAENGIEALRMIRESEPEVLLSDIRMPGMDGITLMAEAKRDYPQLKVIYITAYHQLDYALKAIELGASGFVLKPTDPEEIMNECRKAKQQIEREREQERHAEGMRDRLKEYELVLQRKAIEEQEPSAYSPVVRELLHVMEAGYMEDLTIQSLAQRSHFHPDYLSRLFKKETGDTFLNVLTRIRMQQAVTLLAEPSVKVYEIADRVGFRDSRYFGQMFKKRYGVTPQEYRKRLQHASTQPSVMEEE
jgi:two-component system, response regulator YesN